MATKEWTCKKCSYSENPMDAEFCGNCGLTRSEAAKAEVDQETILMSEEEITKQTRPATSDIIPRHGPFSRKQILIALAGLSFLAALLMVAYWPKSRPDGPGEVNGGPDGSPIKLRLATYWRSDLPILADNVRDMVKDINNDSNGQLQIDVIFAGQPADSGGGIIAPRDLFGAVSTGRVDMVHSAAYYWEDRVRGASFFSAVPFGMDAEQMDSWINENGGLELWRELYKTHKVIPFPCGHTGEQMGGWFDREILTIEDFQGLRMRIPGLGGKVLNKAGVTTTSHGPQEILDAKKANKIDAAEWIGAYHDTLLGLHEEWTYYYRPGWQERDTMFELLINENIYNKLPEHLRGIIERRSREYNHKIRTQFSVRNREYEELLKGKRVNFRTFPRSVLSRLRGYRNEVLSDYNRGDTQKIYQSYSAYLEKTSPVDRL
jgi:TRAP-type mannitol/chloroaromatic compound transport system substrate-binding protein